MRIKLITQLCQDQRFDEALGEVESVLEGSRECARLWVLRANLIQLAEFSTLTLEDAEKSYLAALDLDPDYLEALEDLAHFYYAVMDDRVRTRAIVERLDARLERLTGGLRKVRSWLD